MYEIYLTAGIDYMRLSNVKIGYRVGFVFSLILSVLASIMIIALVFHTHARHQLTQVIGESSARFAAVSSMRQNLFQQAILERQLETSDDLESMRKNMADIIVEKRKYDQLEAQLRAQKLNPEEQAILTKISSYKEDMWHYQKQAEDFLDTLNGAKAAQILSTRAFPLQKQWTNEIDRLINIQNQHVQNITHTFNETSDSINKKSFLAGSVLLFLAGALVWYLSKSITTPLNHIIELSKQIVSGNFDATITPMEGRDETNILLFLLGEMLNKFKDSQEALLKTSNQDGLTLIANRRSFDRALMLEWRRLMRHWHNLSTIRDEFTYVQSVFRDSSLALLMIDVDYFKQYNDHYGLQAGDDCLRRVAEAISGVLKRPTDLAARYDGEKFAVILPGVMIDGARIVAENIRLAVDQLQLPSGDRCFVTVSIGVAVSTPMHSNVNPEIFIATANTALREAKDAGRNQVVSKLCEPINPNNPKIQHTDDTKPVIT